MSYESDEKIQYCHEVGCDLSEIIATVYTHTHMKREYIAKLSLTCALDSMCVNANIDTKTVTTKNLVKTH